MNTAIVTENKTKKEQDIINNPCLTLIMPLGKKDYELHIKKISERAAHELKEQSGVKAKLLIEKLNQAITKINNKTDKKSVLIFLSEKYEKIFYLDISLEEKIIINEPFEIRDLVDYMQPTDKYLLLLQSGNHFKIFLGNQHNLIRIKTSIPDNVFAIKNDIPEKIEYFSDVTDRKEIMLDKFIQHIDKELETIRHHYPLPVFVIGAERMNGHFKKHTHNEKAIVDYIHGNYEEAKPHELLHLLQPFLKELNDIENDALKLKIEQAMNASKFSYGIEEVWRNVMHNKGNLLLVERNYTYPHNSSDESGNLNNNIKEVRPELVKDAVDIIIEKVLGSGGTVKFVDPDLLKDYSEIALFLYY